MPSCTTLNVILPDLEPSNRNSHLGFHKLPSKAEATCIRNLTSEAKYVSNDRNIALFDLHSIVTSFCRRTDELQGQIALHHALVSPIRRIPDEILSEIFFHLHSLWNDGEHEPYRGWHKQHVLISIICRRWRTVSLLTPALWSHICLDVNDKHAEKLINCFLERSKALRYH